MATAFVAAATAACGVLLLGGVGPAPATGIHGDVPPEPDDLGATTTAPVPATTDAGSTSVATAPPATEPTVPSTTADPAPDPPSPVPLGVAPTTVTVGVGGTAQISGTCPVVDGRPRGPVEVWEVGDTVTIVHTGVTAAEWTYEWTAPTDVRSLVLQVWCGDPTGYLGGYPTALEIEVVFVAQEAPPAQAPALGSASGPRAVIPETG